MWKQDIEYLFKTAYSPPKMGAQLVYCIPYTPTYLFASAAHVYNSILWRHPFFQISNASRMPFWSETKRIQTFTQIRT